MVNNTKHCDLCGLVVKVDGFKLHTKEGDKEFCCEGCKGIYEMLHGDEVLTESGESD